MRLKANSLQATQKYSIHQNGSTSTSAKLDAPLPPPRGLVSPTQFPSSSMGNGGFSQNDPIYLYKE